MIKWIDTPEERIMCWWIDVNEITQNETCREKRIGTCEKRWINIEVRGESLTYICLQRRKHLGEQACATTFIWALSGIFKFDAQAHGWCCWWCLTDLNHLTSFHFRTFFAIVFLNICWILGMHRAGSLKQKW